MVGFNFLYQMNLWLRSIFARPDQYFERMNILFGGDFAQLSPVGDSALYSKINKQSLVIKLAAKKAYDAFTETIVLTESMRQPEEDVEACQFRDTLSQLQDEPILMENWRFLLTRAKESLPSGTWQEFDNALRLYFCNEEVQEHNWSYLEKLGQPVMKIWAKPFFFFSFMFNVYMQPYGYNRHEPSPSQKKMMPSQKDPLFSSPFLRRLAAHAASLGLGL